MNSFMPPSTRWGLLARITALASSTGSTNPIPRQAPPVRDDFLFSRCVEFVDLEQRKMLLYDGPGAIIDDDEREEQLAPISAGQTHVLQALCDTPSINLAGLRAKAIVWTLWDCGEVVRRAALHDLVEDRLLVSLLRDLGAAA